MALRLTLKPNEKLIINGCVITNADRRQVISIENKADIVRGAHLLDENDAATPVKKVYFFVQSALLRPEIRDDIVPVIQKNLGQLAVVFNQDIAAHIFEAANYISNQEYYYAMRSLREVMAYEQELMALMASRKEEPAPEMQEA